MIVNMRDNLRILLIANYVERRIVDSFCQSIRDPRDGFPYGACIFWRKFRNPRTMEFGYDECMPGSKR